MGRTVDQEVHAAFVEFRAKEDDKVKLPYFMYLGNISINLNTDSKPTSLYSVFRCNVSIASRSERRILAGRSSTCWNARRFVASITLTPNLLRQTESLPQLVMALLPAVLQGLRVLGQRPLFLLTRAPC